MTAALARTLRDSLGLTLDQAARLAGVRGDRSVKYWESASGRCTPPPADYIGVLRDLDRSATEIAGRYVAMWEQQGRPDRVVLYRPAGPDDLRDRHPGLPDDITWKLNLAAIDRARQALERQGVLVGIEWRSQSPLREAEGSA